MFARVRKARVLADSNGDVSPRARASAPAWSSTGEPFPPSCAMPGVAARSCSGAAETTKSVPHGVPFDNAYDVAAAYADPSSAVVIAGLQELNAIAEDLVDQAIGLVDAPRPEVAAEILEVVGLPNPARGIPERRFHQVQHAQRVFRLVSTQKRRSARHSSWSTAYRARLAGMLRATRRARGEALPGPLPSFGHVLPG